MLATVPQPHHPAREEEAPVPLLACVPAPPGATRLAFAWGLGPRLLLTPLGGGGEGRTRRTTTPPAASVVQWYGGGGARGGGCVGKKNRWGAPMREGKKKKTHGSFLLQTHRSALSALERRLVYDTLPALEGLYTDLAAGAWR